MATASALAFDVYASMAVISSPSTLMKPMDQMLPSAVTMKGVWKPPGVSCTQWM